ncbi:MAG: AAA family ATPase, partial [Lachnospiraceae bacterium]|nr:AAA family ATPase [Lachnospiraceae bacterium]
MPKKSTVFFCNSCGYESSKWMGQCPSCKEWNTFTEEPVVKTSKAVSSAVRGTAEPVLLKDISADDSKRIKTGFSEFDRVLGGGIVKGSLVLIGGDPGIGKSTLLLQVTKNLVKAGENVLYVSGEESLRQIKLRANRLGTDFDNLLLLCETNLDAIT